MFITFFKKKKKLYDLPGLSYHVKYHEEIRLLGKSELLSHNAPFWVGLPSSKQ